MPRLSGARCNPLGFHCFLPGLDGKRFVSVLEKRSVPLGSFMLVNYTRPSAHLAVEEVGLLRQRRTWHTPERRGEEVVYLYLSDVCRRDQSAAATPVPP